jgi:transposase InsO family protein
VRFTWIQAQREAYPLAVLCRVLAVTRGGFYVWQARQGRDPSPAEQRRKELAEQIQQVHEQSRRTYGSPRVYQELKAQGQSVCENTVARLMKQQGLASVVRRRFRVRTTDSCHAHSIAPNVLERCFDQDLPNRAWAADITYVPTAEGWLYLAAVMDLCSRRIVGWSMAEHLRAELCTGALEMALQQRRPAAGLIHHSDRGVQYACGEYRDLLQEQGMQCSMSGKGDCYDNAVMESFFKTLKTERVYQQQYKTREEARRSIFQYIEGFYNRKRRHSSLGYVSPAEYEAALN